MWKLSRFLRRCHDHYVFQGSGLLAPIHVAFYLFTAVRHEARSRKQALKWARAGIKTAQLNDSSRLPSILFSIFVTAVDINKLYQYITAFNLINITIKIIAINTGRLWRRPVLGQSEIVCMVAIYWMYKAACVASDRWCAGERWHCWTHPRKEPFAIIKLNRHRFFKASTCWTFSEPSHPIFYQPQFLINNKLRLNTLKVCRLFSVSMLTVLVAYLTGSTWQ